MAWRKDADADPVGRGCGAPEPEPPPKPPPDGGVTPCCSRHLRKEVFCVVPEVVPEPAPDEPAELELQPATKITATSAIALSVVERARERRITWYLLVVSRRSSWLARPKPVPSAGKPRAVNGDWLVISLWLPRNWPCPAGPAGRVGREPGSRLNRYCAAAGKHTRNEAPWPGLVSTVIAPPCAAVSDAAMAKPRPVPPRALLRASSTR